MKTVSIGIMREDGDFAILATLNNNDGHIEQADFDELVSHIASTLCRKMVCEVQVIERQDTPDYVEVEQ